MWSQRFCGVRYGRAEIVGKGLLGVYKRHIKLLRGFTNLSLLGGGPSSKIIAVSFPGRSHVHDDRPVSAGISRQRTKVQHQPTLCSVTSGTKSKFSKNILGIYNQTCMDLKLTLYNH